MLSEFATMFASILLHAFERTTRSGYLDEAITRYRDLYKISAAPKLIHFDVGHNPFVILWKRVSICSPAVARRTSRNSCNSALSFASDSSGEVFTRFEISCFWAINARANRRPSTSIAFEMAMSLLQETPVLCPTLQTQHHLLGMG